MDIINISFAQILLYIIRIVAAFLLALPVAWNREQSTRIMGLRTFPLVAVASCGFVLLAVEGAGMTSESAQARILQGLMTGIGFVGGGAILKQDGGVHGTATAVSIWTTGALGAAVAFGQYEIAILIGLVNFLTLSLLTPIKQRLDDKVPESELTAE